MTYTKEIDIVNHGGDVIGRRFPDIEHIDSQALAIHAVWNYVECNGANPKIQVGSRFEIQSSNHPFVLRYSLDANVNGTQVSVSYDFSRECSIHKSGTAYEMLVLDGSVKISSGDEDGVNKLESTINKLFETVEPT